MNFGDCPYCDGFTGFFEVPEKTPCYTKVKCESCGKEIWYKFSRVDPMSWTIEDFEKEFDIDEINKKITSKLKENGLTLKMIEDNKKYFEEYFKELDSFILNGDPAADKPIGILNLKDLMKPKGENE